MSNERDIQPAPQAIEQTGVDDKHDVDLIEKVERDALPEDTIMKSPFEDLNVRQTWSTFRKCAFICLLSTFSAAAE